MELKEAYEKNIADCLAAGTIDSGEVLYDDGKGVLTVRVKLKGSLDFITMGFQMKQPTIAAFCGNCGRQPWDCKCLKADPEETPRMGDFDDLKFDDSDLTPGGRVKYAKDIEETPPAERIRGRICEVAAGVGRGHTCYFCGRKGQELAEVKSIRALICGGCAMEHLS